MVLFDIIKVTWETGKKYANEFRGKVKKNNKSLKLKVKALGEKIKLKLKNFNDAGGRMKRIVEKVREELKDLNFNVRENTKEVLQAIIDRIQKYDS